MSASLGTISYGFERVKVDQFPVGVDVDCYADIYKMARSRKEFIELAGQTIEQIEAWISEQEAAIEATHQEGSDQA